MFTALRTAAMNHTKKELYMGPQHFQTFAFPFRLAVTDSDERDNRCHIVGNCDSTLFLGDKEKGTLKEISELLGKETIDSLSQSENRGAQTSHGLSYQKLGKPANKKSSPKQDLT